ncbi:MAG: glycine/sarcosine/betaine reductase selenoprotein B family protein, partial [Actinomycetota bacterium]|nr:glycine/sarcosine/betaine reductase selenoprotein B family protein [Actinomycetota bacterium]
MPSERIAFKTMAFMKTYPWRQIDPVPWAPLSKPLAECRVALVSSAATILPDGERFDYSGRAGDPTFRLIPSDTDPRVLIETHPNSAFDHSGMARDMNVAFPLERIRELAEIGRIGEVAPRHLSFAGYLPAPGRLRKTTAPEAARTLVDDGVDVALL